MLVVRTFCKCMCYCDVYIQEGERMVRGLMLLGLCPWGYIKNSDLLVNENINKFNYVTYNSNLEIRKGDNVPLNGDHTHFLMVDDGSKYRFFGGYTNFITRFETMVRDPESEVMRVHCTRFPLVGLCVKCARMMICSLREVWASRLSPFSWKEERTPSG